MPEPARTPRFFSEGAWHDAADLSAATSLRPATRSPAPALIIEPHQTIVVEPGWAAEVTPKDHIVLRRAAPRAALTHAIGTDADPVMLEVFNNLFMSIAEQMGVTLQNTAYSVNIKERLDFSCALFDATGALVANAPHMPVHLGSMDRSVDIVRRLNPDIAPGDVYALNAPYNGGTHLPDITVVTPVFEDAGDAILFWVASRGHHADVGGTAPGSMTPRATTVDEEGVLIDNFKLVDRGRFREAELHTLLTDHPYPCRNPAQNIADLKAQIAANEKGVGEIRKMVRQFGLDVVQAYMRHVRDNAAESVRRVHREAARFGVRVSDRPGLGDQGEDHRRQGEALGEGRFHRHVAGAAEQFQRPCPGDARGGALRLPRDGGGQHPDERRVPGADRDRHPGRLDAGAAISARRRRRQRRDQPARDQRALRRARRAVLGAGLDEQPHLRQRPLPVLRDDLLRRAGGRVQRRRPASTAPTASTRT